MHEDLDEVDPGPIPGDDPSRGFQLPTNERDYIVPAQDAKGHHVRLYCRAMPAIGRLVADVHASRKYPFRTMGDLIRWSIVTGSKRLASGAQIPSVINHVDAMIAVLQDEEFQLQFMEFFKILERVTGHYIKDKAAGEARRVVAAARAQIESMPDGYWKDRYRGELLNDYSSLLDAGGTGGSFDVHPD